MCMFGGGGDGGAADRAAAESRAASEQARMREEARQARITSGREKIAGAFKPFDDKFFGDREQAYLDYATPEVDRQYKAAHDKLVYSLSRSGLLSSSEGARQLGELKQEYDRNREGVVGQARDIGRQARGSVEENRSALDSQLLASEDPDAVAASAGSRAATLSTGPSFSPLGILFQNLTAAGAQTALSTGKPLGEVIGARLFGDRSSSGGGSSKIVQGPG